MVEPPGQVAIATGGGRGIGRAAAPEMAKAGAMLTSADINGRTIGTVKREIEEPERKP